MNSFTFEIECARDGIESTYLAIKRLPKHEDMHPSKSTDWTRQKLVVQPILVESATMECFFLQSRMTRFIGMGGIATSNNGGSVLAENESGIWRFLKMKRRRSKFVDPFLLAEKGNKRREEQSPSTNSVKLAEKYNPAISND
ncbi:hypothetical protein Fot_30772 [Forsythia ovata]|uniref:Uncharacterized protein n=1 Tax=Forsythia ovata TaxID=205694 RepID=A0ABD1T3C0_9LAMI